MRSLRVVHWAMVAVTWFAMACSGEDKPKTNAVGCAVGTSTGCTNGQVCERVVAGDPGCFDPIQIQGKVIDAISNAPIANALVVARDANGAAISGTASTNASGQYSLVVPVERDTKGNPTANGACTLRADASLYQSFPTAPRVAIPIDVTQPTAGVISSAATDIALLPLPSASGGGTITGQVALDDPKGTLVVAGTVTALASADGSFTLFNVPAGDVTVEAYRQGSNLEPVTVTVTANSTARDTTLRASNEPAVTISGKVEIVNPGKGSTTSVILVVASTFVENAARGEAPPGLRAANVNGTFSIAGVPDGDYVVLAAFENDFLVRDPDTCIGGTSIVRVSVAGQDVALAEGFKVTGALDVVSPDSEALVAATPTFVWADDSSEDHYQVVLYDAFGNKIWEDLTVPSVSGNKNVSVVYGGPALTPGMVYQYRATSIKKGDCPISRTEDLRGVFRAQ